MSQSGEVTRKKKARKGVVLLSFDIEEFDFPRERGVEISLDEGVKVSSVGLKRILDVLKAEGVKATFFTTGNFAHKAPELVKRIVAEGHELACHGVDHFEPKPTDLAESKKIIEKVGGVKVFGYRQPRMQKIDYKEMTKCGYKYDSSVNPAFIPGRYNHLDTPRKPFKKEGILEIPTSVATFARVPLFWLALHNFPEGMYYKMVKMSLKKTGYFATYFHPWEFADIRDRKEVPFYIKKNSGVKLAKRLERLVEKLQRDGYEFGVYAEHADSLDHI